MGFEPMLAATEEIYMEIKVTAILHRGTALYSRYSAQPLASLLTDNSMLSVTCTVIRMNHSKEIKKRIILIHLVSYS